jgi:hypothetical protein
MKVNVIAIGALGTASALATWLIQAQVHNRPFTGLDEGVTYDWEERKIDGDTETVQTVATYAYRKDGSSVEVVGLQSNAGPVNFRTIIDLSIPAKRITGAAIKAVSSKPLSASELQYEHSRLTWCAHADHDPANYYRFTNWEKLQGFDVIHTVLEPQTMSDRTLSPRVEKWFAPALGCAELMEVIVFSQRDRDGDDVSIYREAKNLRLGDPDPSFFSIPADWEELSPAQADLKAHRLFPEQYEGRECAPDNRACINTQEKVQAALLQAENEYWAAQTNR